MPNLLTHEGWRFFFYSNEGNPRESAHVHARKAGAEAKFWLEPDVTLAAACGVDARTQRWLHKVVQAHREAFLRSWYDYFA